MFSERYISNKGDFIQAVIDICIAWRQVISTETYLNCYVERLDMTENSKYKTHFNICNKDFKRYNLIKNRNIHRKY